MSSYFYSEASNLLADAAHIMIRQ